MINWQNDWQENWNGGVNLHQFLPKRISPKKKLQEKLTHKDIDDLKKLLPKQDNIIDLLFSGQNFCFGNPLD